MRESLEEGLIDVFTELFHISVRLELKKLEVNERIDLQCVDRGLRLMSLVT